MKREGRIVLTGVEDLLEGQVSKNMAKNLIRSQVTVTKGGWFSSIKSIRLVVSRARSSLFSPGSSFMLKLIISELTSKNHVN